MSRPRPKMVFDDGVQKAEASVERVITETRPTETLKQASRIGKRAVTVYVSSEAFKQLGVLSATTDRTIQDLMTEAVNWTFQQHGLARIAKD